MIDAGVDQAVEPVQPDSCSPHGKRGFALDGKKLVAGVADPGPASARPATTPTLFPMSRTMIAIEALGTV
jgi:hypothetical protein